MALSLQELDITTPCNQGYEFEYVPESTGIPSGVFLTVIGSHAEDVKKWVRKELNQMRQHEAILQKKGKDDPRTVEQDEQFSIRNAAIRIKGWKGILDNGAEWPFSFENACKLCELNPEIRNQVVKESESLGNFIQSK